MPRQTTDNVSEPESQAFPQAEERPGAENENACILCRAAMEVVLTGVTDNRLGAPGSFEIRRCVRCGFEQTFPLPSQQQLKELYETYYNFGGQSGVLYTRLRERFLLSFVNRLWVWLDGDVAFQSRRGSGRLLDIGCNEGRGLRIYRANGFQVEGLELNENAATVARAAGFNVHTCLLEEFRPATGFDVALLSNVLEHSLDPRHMLLDVHRVLAAGGQVWISCPHNGSWLRKVFGKTWINWHVPFHISHFSADTLKNLLQQSGFSRVDILQITPAHWAAASVIARLFAQNGRPTRSIRNPALVLALVALARFVFFPLLWLGNRLRRGDCLLVTATKTPDLAANS